MKFCSWYRTARCPASISRGIFKAYYRKRGSASYIVREVHSVSERDTERERERERWE